MIGTYYDAEAAAKNLYQFFDEGSSRRVYLINGVIYKVNLSDEWDENMEEWNRYVELKRGYMDPEVALPETHLYRPGGVSVIAMEYIQGTGLMACYCTSDEPCDETCMKPSVVSMCRKYIEDLGGMNVIHSNGLYYLIDLGC